MPRSLNAQFTAAKNALYAKPFYSAIFHFGGSVGDAYVSNREITISGNIYKALVRDWGEYSGVAEVREGTFFVPSMNLDLINLPLIGSPAKRFTDLWSGLGVEAVEVDIHQNFIEAGTNNVLQDLLFKAVMRPGEYSPSSCALELVGISEKYLEKNEISEPILASDFLLADPDDIGARMNLIYGKPKTVRCHAVKAGLQFPLQEAMSAVSGYIAIAQDAYDRIGLSGTVQIGDEQIVWISKTTTPTPRLTGLTRSANATPLQSHAKDDNIVQVLTEYIYLIAGHKIKSASNVKIWRGGLGYPLAGGITIEVANTTLVSGKTLAIVKIATPPVVKELPVVELSDSRAVQDTIAVNDGITVNDGATVVDQISVVDNIGVVDQIGVSDTIGIDQPNPETSWEQQASDETLNFPANSSVPNGGFQEIAIAFPAQEKTKSSGSFSKKITASMVSGWSGAGGIGFYLVKGDGSTVKLKMNPANGDSFSPSAVELTYWGLKLRRVNESGTTANWGPASVTVGGKSNSYHISSAVSKIGGAFKTGAASKSGSASKGGSAFKSGAVTKGGAATKSGTVSLTGSTTLSQTTTAEVVLGEYLTVDVEGYEDDASGTITGAPNALIENPIDVIHHLARVVGGVPVNLIDTAAFAQAKVDMPTYYKFAGVMTERSTNLKVLLLALSMQCRSIVEWLIDKLTVRFRKSSYGLASKTITQENIMRGSGRRTTLKIRRSDSADLLNVVNLFYARRWYEPRSIDAFNKVTFAQDGPSITKYRRREDWERFQYDFIPDDNDAMAVDLRDFYLALYKEPKRFPSFECKLDEYDLTAGDVVALHFKTNVATGEVFDNLDGLNKFLIEAPPRLRPGSSRDRRGTRLGLLLREVS